MVVHRWTNLSWRLNIALSSTDGRHGIRDLRNPLSDNASQFLRHSAKDSYTELVGKLEQRYGTRNQKEKYRAEIRRRWRRKDEPVTELAESIRRLMVLAYPGDQADE